MQWHSAEFKIGDDVEDVDRTVGHDQLIVDCRLSIVEWDGGCAPCLLVPTLKGVGTDPKLKGIGTDLQADVITAP